MNGIVGWRGIEALILAPGASRHFHDDLVDALIEGDGDRAAQLAEAALRGDQRKVMEALADTAAQVPLGRRDLGS